LIWAATAILGALALPHLWPRLWLSPVNGMVLWLAVLTLRASVVAAAIPIVVLYVPSTEIFQIVTHWCFHAVLPVIALHLGFSGHTLGDAALLVPALVLAISTLYAVQGAWRAARLVARWQRSSSLGSGPRRSVLVGGSDVLVAAAGLRRPHVVVSTGALAKLDDDELLAGLEHEWGHIHRKHRFWALAGTLLFAFARLLPGGRRALEELHFHLERDADEYAVRKTGDPLALANAICKAAIPDRPEPMPLVSLAGHAGRGRLGALIDRQRPGRVIRISGFLLAVLPATLALALLASLPTLASIGLDQAAGTFAHYCA
jgi:Zn-dependent protease with chaperone function